MKNAKKIIGTMVLATALLGTGYAAWTDKLEVDVNVSTGKLDVSFSDVKLQEGYSAYLVPNEKETYIEQENIHGKGDFAQISIGNFYPGATATYTLDIVNEGTIPAAIEDLVITGQLIGIGSGDITQDNWENYFTVETSIENQTLAVDGETTCDVTITMKDVKDGQNASDITIQLTSNVNQATN